MIERDDQVYLGHIRDAIDKIHRYVDGIDEAEFSSNSMIQDAVIRQFQVIGEAVKALSVEDDIPRPGNSMVRVREIQGQTHSSVFWC